MLRITDRVEEELILDVLKWDTVCLCLCKIINLQFSFDMCCDLQCRFVLSLDRVSYKTSLNRRRKFHFVLYF